MRRREFITLTGALAAVWPLPARAQQRAKVARIGYLGLVSASWHTPRVTAFRAGLRDLGYVEGKDFVIEFRWAEGQYDRLPALAAELARLNVDVIVTHAAPGAFAAKKATPTIPIVITAIADLVALGLVENLAHPGGNLTGLSFFNAELIAKRLELLKELAPSRGQGCCAIECGQFGREAAHPQRVGSDREGVEGGTVALRGACAGRFRGRLCSDGQSADWRSCPPRGSGAECKLQGLLWILRPGTGSQHVATRNSW